MPRKPRYYHKESDDSDFETEALQLASKATVTKSQPERSLSDSEGETNQELDQSDDDDATPAHLKQSDDSEDDDDDDDAPQAVSFAKSKTEALGKIRDAMQQVVEQRKEQQLKRQKIDEKNKEQKRQKLEKLSKSRLPDKLLDAIPSQPTRAVPEQEAAVTGEKTMAENVQSGSDSEDAESLSDGHNSEDEDFIPFDRTAGVTVLSLAEAARKSKSVTMTAAEFKQNMLFGNRIHRQTTQEMMNTQKKRRARFS